MKQSAKDRPTNPDGAQEVRIGPVTLMLPPGFDGQLLSTPDCPANCSEFVAQSPEGTIYNSPAYIGFARRENGAADVLIVRFQGKPLFALPIHPDSRGRWISTGYSGVLFPESNRETVLRASVSAVRQLLDVNRALGFRSEQSAQAPGYGSAERMALLAQLLCDSRNRVRPTYTRVLGLSASATGVTPDVMELDAAALENEMLGQYDGDIRNQIRQALRRGLRVQQFVLGGDAVHERTAEAYRRYVPVQIESYVRTGMPPHDMDYWMGLSDAVQRGGGRDVVVLVVDESGADVAGVTCHAFRGRAIYWSGASTATGKSNRANPLALHAAISSCASLGITTFELGRFDATELSEKERAITHYKAQFRGHLLPVLNFVRPPQTARAQVGALVTSIRSGVGRIVAVAQGR